MNYTWDLNSHKYWICIAVADVLRYNTEFSQSLIVFHKTYRYIVPAMKYMLLAV